MYNNKCEYIFLILFLNRNNKLNRSFTIANAMHTDRYTNRLYRLSSPLGCLFTLKGHKRYNLPISLLLQPCILLCIIKLVVR